MSEVSVEALAPGCKVSFGPDDESEGTLLAFSATYWADGSLRITYLVSWWDGMERREEWMNGCEVSVTDVIRPKMQKIGFTFPGN